MHVKRGSKRGDSLGRADDVDGRRASLQDAQSGRLNPSVCPRYLERVPEQEDLGRVEVGDRPVPDPALPGTVDGDPLALELAQERMYVLSDPNDVGLVSDALVEAGYVPQKGKRDRVLREEAVLLGRRVLRDDSRGLRSSKDERVGLLRGERSAKVSNYQSCSKGRRTRASRDRTDRETPKWFSTDSR